MTVDASPRVYAETVSGIDRLPQFLPLAEGWDWYQFYDGEFSSRWLADQPALGPASYPEGTVFRCTHCGRETTNLYVIRRHNGLVAA